MNWRYLPLIVVFLLTFSCSNDPAAKPFWASDANQEIMDSTNEPYDQPDQKGSALLVINDFRCGELPDGSYQFDVAWTSTVEGAQSLRVEYQVVSAGDTSATVGMNNPTVAAEISEPAQMGSTLIDVDGVSVGDQVVLRVVVTSGTGEVASPTNTVDINIACAGSGGKV